MLVKVVADINVKYMSEDELKDKLIYVISDALLYGTDPNMDISLREVNFQDEDIQKEKLEASDKMDKLRKEINKNNSIADNFFTYTGLYQSIQFLYMQGRYDAAIATGDALEYLLKKERNQKDGGI